MSYPPIAEYAVIGDCRTAALIGRDGGVDWYCPGRFDAPAVFCRLLDWNVGGTFRIAPCGDSAAERRYRPNTNILETTFTTGGGSARLTDCMPVATRSEHRRGSDPRTSRKLMRFIEGLSGEVELDVHFEPTFDYARAPAELSPVDGCGVIARAGQQYLSLAYQGGALTAEGGGGVRGQLRIRRGDRHWLILSEAASPDPARQGLHQASGDEALERTAQYWEEWSRTCHFQGPHRERVLRSALALKLLMYEPTGAFVAAPTTSLPEEVGGVRNWDYRYTWLRDACLTLYALMTLGFDDEADDFFSWLRDVTHGDPTAEPQIMYGIGGERELPERVLDHLDGYRGSRPVRIGNAAARQQQLDIYGEVLNAAYLHFRGRRHRRAQVEPPPKPAWALLRGFVERAAERWRENDHGIWEVRGRPRPFLHSKLLCWAALDRGLRLAEEDGLDAPFDRWRRTREEIRQAILSQGYSQQQRAFTEAFGSRALDAAALAIPRIGFLPATDPRVLSTIDRISEALSRDGLVHRYCTEDGLPGGEGTFTLCTFWLVEALALAGRVDEAHALFERVVGYANDVGLLSEEVDPGTRELLGNFPQAFTHLALISAAVNLAKTERHGAEEEAQTEGERVGHARRAARRG